MIKKSEVIKLKEIFTNNKQEFFEKTYELLGGDNKEANLLRLKEDSLRDLKENLELKLITKGDYDVEYNRIRLYMYNLVDKIYNEFEYYENLIIDSKASIAPLKSDINYQRLRKLNFITHHKNFNDLVDGNKKVHSFIINAEGRYGQEWLFHKLIYDYFESKNAFSQPLLIDFNSRNIFDLDKMLNEVCKDLGIEDYEGKPLLQRKIMIKNVILKKIKSESQFLVFKNSFSFLEKNLDDFYNILCEIQYEIVDYEKNVKNKDKEIDEKEVHKCFIFLIENNTRTYVGNKHFIFLSETPVFKAKAEVNLKFIDLGAIQPITVKCIEDWLGALPEDLLNCIDCSDEAINNIILNSENGNPEKVIPEVCKLININFEENKHLWLKF